MNTLTTTDAATPANPGIGFAQGRLANHTTLAAVSGWNEYKRIDRSGKNRQGWHLEAVRDSLIERQDRFAPYDLDRSTGTCLFESDGSHNLRMRIQLPDGHKTDFMTLSRHAQRQLSGFLLPAHAMKVYSDLAQLTLGDKPLGAMLASGVWNGYARANSRPLKFRLIGDCEGQDHVRAVVSQTYGLYDCLPFIQTVLRALGDRADQYRVIGYDVNESHMRVRLVGGNPEALEAWNERSIDKPIPLVQLWNSETGQRSIRVASGTYTMWCSNTMGALEPGDVFRWPHSAHVERHIEGAIEGAMHDVMVKGQGLAKQYDEALTTGAENLMGWFEATFEGEVTEAQTEGITATMKNNPTVHGGGETLASLVDACTWEAHEMDSLVAQEHLENVAARVLRRGLNDAEDGRLSFTA